MTALLDSVAWAVSAAQVGHQPGVSTLMWTVTHLQEQKAIEQEAARAEKEAQRAAKAAEKAQRDAMREAARKQKEVPGFARTLLLCSRVICACSCRQCPQGPAGAWHSSSLAPR